MTENRLQEYTQKLIDEGFDTRERVADMEAEDIEACGISKRGHLKSLKKAIAALAETASGETKSNSNKPVVADVMPNQFSWPLPSGCSFATSCAISPNSRTAVVAFSSSSKERQTKLLIWDVQTGEIDNVASLSIETAVDETKSIRKVQFSVDGKQLLVCASTGYRESLVSSFGRCSRLAVKVVVGN